MNRTAVRERVQPQVERREKIRRGVSPAFRVDQPHRKKRVVSTRPAPHRRQVEQRLARHKENQRFQHELKEMRETEDLREVDDDVEDVATLLEWHAEEHTHQPKSAVWFAVLAAGITAVVAGFALFGNFIAAITIGVIGFAMYRVAQKEPDVVRYRVMTEGLAFNDTLYHYRDLESFNIVYEPGEVKTVLLKSKKTFSPLLNMEIGDADPVVIRDVLIEFIQEDQELDEPAVDVWARRLGF